MTDTGAFVAVLPSTVGTVAVGIETKPEATPTCVVDRGTPPLRTTVVARPKEAPPAPTLVVLGSAGVTVWFLLTGLSDVVCGIS